MVEATRWHVEVCSRHEGSTFESNLSASEVFHLELLPPSDRVPAPQQTRMSEAHLQVRVECPVALDDVALVSTILLEVALPAEQRDLPCMARHSGDLAHAE